MLCAEGCCQTTNSTRYVYLVERRGGGGYLVVGFEHVPWMVVDPLLLDTVLKLQQLRDNGDIFLETRIVERGVEVLYGC
jgi:hypothetical protein